MADVEAFCELAALSDYVALFKKGALVAQNSAAFEKMPELDEGEREALRIERTKRWQHPRIL